MSRETIMATDRKTIATARQTAQAAGFYLRKIDYAAPNGDYQITRWCVEHDVHTSLRCFDLGYPTQSAAWLAVTASLATN